MMLYFDCFVFVFADPDFFGACFLGALGVFDEGEDSGVLKLSALSLDANALVMIAFATGSSVVACVADVAVVACVDSAAVVAVASWFVTFRARVFFAAFAVDATSVVATNELSASSAATFLVMCFDGYS